MMAGQRVSEHSCMVNTGQCKVGRPEWKLLPLSVQLLPLVHTADVALGVLSPKSAQRDALLGLLSFRGALK